MTDTTDMRRDFEALAFVVLGDNPTWRESADCEFAWRFWQAATERAAPKWISVMDQLPEPQVRVLAFAEGYREPCIDVWFGSDFEWGYSHWMPLPPPPAIRQGGDT